MSGGKGDQDGYITKLGYALLRLDKVMELETPDGLTMREIRIRVPQAEGDDYMVVVKATAGGHPFVAFHAAAEAHEALKGAIERIANGHMKWREDRPYQPGVEPARPG